MTKPFDGSSSILTGAIDITRVISKCGCEYNGSIVMKAEVDTMEELGEGGARSFIGKPQIYYKCSKGKPCPKVKELENHDYTQKFGDFLNRCPDYKGFSIDLGL